ncbi:Uncharacterised protein [Vibrio cholerae]|nr:Uncharacterised protein [Vibrio cholerae]
MLTDVEQQASVIKLFEIAAAIKFTHQLLIELVKACKLTLR